VDDASPDVRAAAIRVAEAINVFISANTKK